MRTPFATALRWLGRNRHVVLFFMLVATIALGPVLAATGKSGHVLNICLGLTLLATTLAPMRDRTVARAFFVFVMATILVGLAPIGGGVGDAGPATLALWSAIALFAAARAVRYAMSSRRVDMQHLMAALNAYLLVGVFLGALWAVVDHAWPGSVLSGGAPIAGGLAVPDGIYFSFVTLATLGYGDIVPVTPVARGIAVFEAVFGQLYLAVMVARLVSLHIAAEPRDRTP
ncbi:potassium channel family protein [Lysobacter sp. KIS68-7]|uniref:potassium channel family protein n=1 Tax=Lysobacter sp. KIS68-7 TaxID=2904252 RepID=UPI001E439937|nr:potassium channel family protein [Lysobacter sp. KIS68-7]UHQ20081.1 potassium channel family protein [Lysobacter sp. KIS68-7]